jgi:hypothetical protein
VCKDIAGMAITLCRAAGYEVYPAMTMAGSRVEAIPADQFNHCVGAWKKPDGSWHMLDPTWIPFSRYDWSRAEGEQHYVIGTPEGETLSMIRAYGPEENQLNLKVRGTIDDQGTLHGKLWLEGAGQADTRLRRTLGQTPVHRHADDLRSWLAHLVPGAELGDWTAGEPQDWSRPMTVELAFTLPGYAQVGDRVCSWRPVAANLANHGYGGAVRLTDPPSLPEERETPVMLWWAQAVVLDEEIEVPRGFEPRLATDRWQAGDPDGIASCDITADVKGRTIKHAGTFQFARRQIPVADWNVFREAVTTWTEAVDTRFIARREVK